MTAEPDLTFAQLLRQARREAGLTQEELAERAGISPRAVSSLERGINRAPRRDTLELIFAALDLPREEQARWERTRRQLSTRSGTVSSISDPDYEQLPVEQRTIAIAPPIGRPDLEQVEVEVMDRTGFTAQLSDRKPVTVV